MAMAGFASSRLAASLLAGTVLAALAAAPSQAQTPGKNAATAGELVVEPPTLMALGFEWQIEGDDNRNASVSVEYRPDGKGAWRKGLPMLRLGGEEIIQGASFHVITPNMFAGSVMDLDEGTDYEVRLTLSDPDGADGQAVRVTRVTTRKEPVPAKDGKVFHVYPPDYKGVKVEPAFTSLLQAYNTGANGADWSNSFVPRVQAGDIISVHAGVYKDDRRRYGGRPGFGTLFDGTMYLTAKGTAERPIVIRAAGDGEVVFDGDGNHTLFNLQVADYHYFEGITVRNTEVAFDLGHKRIGGAVGFTLKKSKIVDVGRGVSTDWGGARNFYIADNEFVGRNDQTRLMGWIGNTWAKLPGFPIALRSEYAVKVFGSGHVIAHNSVSFFHDGIDHATYGDPDNWPNTARENMPVALDIYNNDIRNVDDNCIEADGILYNARILRNRCFNQAHRALSTQPALGGPVYFIRNIVYNAPEGGVLKLTANSAGVLIYNNTFVGEVRPMGPVSNVHYRNNLILGRGAWPTVFSTEDFTAYSSSDYNGFRPNPGEKTAFSQTAPDGEARSYTAKRTLREFTSLADYSAATGRDKNSVLVDYNSFVRVAAPDTSDPTRIYDPKDLDFSLVKSSPAVDAGERLPNVTDNAVGKAPDLGALERGSTIQYGPRR